MADKPKLATVWLDGCSGCHMSLLDMDERLLALAARVQIVSSPLVDRKELPPHIDAAIVEGAVGNEEDERRLLALRARTKTLVALGDCAVAGNVPAMRNLFSVQSVLERCYHENAAPGDEPPDEQVPRLCERVRPLHEVVKVDLFLPGCPPPADAIYQLLDALADGRTPDLTGLSRFGR